MRSRPRVTVSLDPDLIDAVNQAVSRYGARNVSRFVESALRHYLAELDRQQLAAEAAQLDAEEEVELTRAAAAAPAPTVWNRLREG